MKVLTEEGYKSLRHRIRDELAREVAEGMKGEWEKTLDRMTTIARADGVEEGLAAGKKAAAGPALGEMASLILKSRRDSQRDQLMVDYAFSRVQMLDDKEEAFDTFLAAVKEAIGMPDSGLQAGIDEARADIASSEARLGEGLKTLAEELEAEDDE